MRDGLLNFLKTLCSYNLTLVEVFVIVCKIKVRISYIGTELIYWYKIKVFIELIYIDKQFKINTVTLRQTLCLYNSFKNKMINAS